MNLEDILSTFKPAEAHDEEEAKGNSDKKERDRQADPFTELMFGTRKKDEPSKKEESVKSELQGGNEANYFTLMEQIDDIMVSLENLKPMLKEFSPIMDYIKKKI
ncbi:hypothetical protein [Bacillus weihaiensis]|uniref:hypothetical protein n=1 Tax=Bacillus weihaiensis TaxID=1547283 RepID=UPI0023531674|nr:hypothetical protein [Bacillus weihaiensis]